jgi:enoyl-CoA hydratase/carnithine racemase
MISLGISVEDRDGVRHVTLDRPDKKNALTVAMYATMADAIDAAADDDVGALLITANGPTFCAGNDIRDFLERSAGADSPAFRFLRALATTDVPLVVGVRGAAVGIGTTMLLHADVVYAAPSAALRLPFVDLGLVPEAGSTVLLPRLLGNARAGAALFLGEVIDAARAERDGLISAIVPDDELDAKAAAAARTIAAKPRGAARATKALLHSDRKQIVEAIGREGAMFAERLQSAEARAVLSAFLERGARG